MTKFLLYLLVYGLLVLVYVTVNVDSCPEFPPPKNGRMICDHLLGKYCTPLCNFGYVPVTLPAWAYVCNPITNRWATYPEFYPLPWPDCELKASNKSGAKNVINAARTKEIFTNSKTTRRQFLPSNTSLDAEQKTTNNRTANSISMPLNNTALIANNATSLLNNTASIISNATSLMNNTASLVNNTLPLTNNTVSTANVTQPKVNNTKTNSNPDLKSTSSNLLQNNSEALAYKITEKYVSNRTMTNKVDFTNITSKHLPNQNELDVENIIITTTRNGVPKAALERSNLTKLHQAKKKDFVENVQTTSVVTTNQTTRNEIFSVVPTAITFGINTSDNNPISSTLSTISEPITHNFSNSSAAPTVNGTSNYGILSSINLSENSPVSSTLPTSGKQNSTNYSPIVGQTFSALPTNNETTAIDRTTLFTESPATNPSPMPSETAIYRDSSMLPTVHVNVNEGDSSVLKDKNLKANILPIEKETVTINRNSTAPLPSTVVIVINNGKATSDKENENHSKKFNKHSHDDEKARDEYKTDENSNEGSGTNEDEITSSKQLEKQEKQKNKKYDKSLKNFDKNRTLDYNNDKRIKSPDKDSNKKVLSSDKNNDKNQTASDKNNDSNLTSVDKEKEEKSISPKTNDGTTLKNHDELNSKDEEAYKNVSSKYSVRLNSLVGSKINKNLQTNEDDYFENVTTTTRIPHGSPPLVPVFTEKDLTLLRRMVSISPNTKRSQLKRSASSLWTTMLRLTANRLKPYKLEIVNRKQLADRDSPLAQLIMKQVNNKDNYNFLSPPNPFLYKDKPHGKYFQSRLKEAKGTTRQYVWNGATFIPVSDTASAQSFLNSNDGGGLTGASKYKWNGATFVPNENYHETGEIQTTNAPETEPAAKDLSDMQTNKEIQKVLDLWNGGSSKKTSDTNPTLFPSMVKNEQYIEASTQKPILLPTEKSQPTEQRDLNKIEINGQTYIPIGAKSEKNNKKGNDLFVWNGEKYLPTSSFNYDVPESIPRYRFNGVAFELADSSTNTEPTLSTQDFTTVNDASKNTTTENNLEWNGSIYVTRDSSLNYHNNNPEGAKIISVKNNKSSSLSVDNSTPTPPLSQTNPKLGDILQTHYPSRPPSSSQVKDYNDRVVAGETSKPTLSIDRTSSKTPEWFEASINYPTQFQDRKTDDEIKNIDRKEEKETSPLLSFVKTPTEKVTTNKNIIQITPTSDERFNTSPLGRENNPNAKIIIPPLNPYLPVESTNEKEASITSTNQTENKQNNIYDPSLTHGQLMKAYTNRLPTVNPNPKNPFREDSEDLEKVIENDLGIKQEIESLSEMYDNSPENDPVSVPSGNSISDLRLLSPHIFDPTTTTESPTKSSLAIPMTTAQSSSLAALTTASNPPKLNLEQELTNDLQNKAPEDKLAEKDIEAADLVLREEEAEQPFAVSTAVVKGNDNKEKSEELKEILRNTGQSDVAALQPIKQEQTKVLEDLNNSEKHDLETTLQQDIQKLQSGKLSQPTTTVSPLSYDESATPVPLPGSESSLNVADIRQLLQITRLAERESAAKKHGLTHPLSLHNRMHKLLQKPGVQKLVRYLMKSHLSPKIILMLRKRKIEQIRHKLKMATDIANNKHKEAIKTMITTWNKRYNDLHLSKPRDRHVLIHLKKGNPLPKFFG